MKRMNYHKDRALRLFLRENITEIYEQKIDRKLIIKWYRKKYGKYKGKYNTRHHRKKIYDRLESDSNTLKSGDSKGSLLRREKNALEYSAKLESERVFEESSIFPERTIESSLPRIVNQYWFYIDGVTSLLQNSFVDNDHRTETRINGNVFKYQDLHTAVILYPEVKGEFYALDSGDVYEIKYFKDKGLIIIEFSK